MDEQDIVNRVARLQQRTELGDSLARLEERVDQRLPQLEDRIHDLEDRVRVLEPIGLHECRHTFASLMIAAGVDAKALSAYMGHASITVALDRYGHLMPGNESEAAELIDTYLARAGGSMQLNAARDALVSASKQR